MKVKKILESVRKVHLQLLDVLVLFCVVIFPYRQ